MKSSAAAAAATSAVRKGWRGGRKSKDSVAKVTCACCGTKFPMLGLERCSIHRIPPDICSKGNTAVQGGLAAASSRTANQGVSHDAS